MNKFDFAKVTSVYSGIAGRCCCGCSGKHYYKNEARELAGKSRGYEIDDDEINDSMVKKVINKIQENISNSENMDTYISIEIGKRLYVAYIA
jgi:hypothetical protein